MAISGLGVGVAPDRLSDLVGWSRPRTRSIGARLEALDLGDDPALTDLPPLTKAELVHDQERHPPFGTNLTYPLDRYTPAASDQRDDRAAAARARHRRGLELVARALRAHADGRRRGRRGPGRADLLVRPARAVLGRQGGPRGGRRDGDRARRDGLDPAPADDRRGGRDRDLVHADLRAAAARGGRRAAAGVGARLGRAGALHRRAGRVAARGAGAHRGGLRRALHRPRRADRGRPLRLPRAPTGHGLHVDESEFVCEIVDEDLAAARRSASAASCCSRRCAAPASRCCATAPATSS